MHHITGASRLIPYIDPARVLSISKLERIPLWNKIADVSDAVELQLNLITILSVSYTAYSRPDVCRLIVLILSHFRK